MRNIGGLDLSSVVVRGMRSGLDLGYFPKSELMVFWQTRCSCSTKIYGLHIWLELLFPKMDRVVARIDFGGGKKYQEFVFDLLRLRCL